MNVLDWVLVAAFVLAALWGFKTGLIDAVLNAIAIYVALFLSGLFAGRVLSLIWDGVESEALSTAIGYVIIFVAVFIASRIVSSMIKKAMKITMMGWVDSVGGIAIGLVAGVLISGGVMTVAARYSFVEDESASEFDASQVMTDGIEGLKDKITGNTIKFASNLGREKGRTLLIESSVVPSLINVKGVVSAFAPEEFSVALERLEEAIDIKGDE